MRLKTINSQNDILEIVQEIGFLPFFENDIEGFSIEENIALEYWFDGYDYEGFYEDGKANYKNKDIYDAINAKDSYLSKTLKRDLNYRKGGNKGFDPVITRLQMQTFVCISDFEYAIDKHGMPYGWGVARYSTPEAMFGEHFLDDIYEQKPETSKKRLYDYLTKLLPHATEKQILKFIG